MQLFGSAVLLLLPRIALGWKVVAPLSSRPARITKPAIIRPPVFAGASNAQTENDGDGDSSSSTASSTTLSGLDVAIVGAGPSGLLLAHRLLKGGTRSVSIYEKRPDPRSPSNSLEGRAYALGLGVRGRTAIRTVDDGLWRTIRGRGFECERFQLHITPKISVTLRDTPKNRTLGGDVLEPSVLLYQSDLCAAMLDELEARYEKDRLENGAKRLKILFSARVPGVDVDRLTIDLIQSDGNDENPLEGGVTKKDGPFDLIVGCDGANSKVRRSMESSSPGGAFKSESSAIPGVFKVVRLPKNPPKLDPNSIHLLLPRGKGVSMTAFVEPTVNRGACILFGGKGGADGDEGNANPLLGRKGSSTDVPRMAGEELIKGFPLLEGIDEIDAVDQLLNQKPASAYSVKCNTYHSGSVAICGDAAHATGGVSGQGCNSALVDATVLSDCLEGMYKANAPTRERENSIKDALLAYSQRQVPEGEALYDLSFGPKDVGPFKKLRYGVSTMLATFFGGRFGIGRPALQTTLTSSLVPFSDIRRERDSFYARDFPSAAEFNRTLSALYPN